MNELTNEQFRILKKLYKKPLSFKKLASKMGYNKVEKFYEYFEYDLYTRYFSELYKINNVDKESDYFNSVISLTNEGKQIVESRREENKRWKTSIIISIIALIFSAIALIGEYGSKILKAIYIMKQLLKK